MITSIVCIALIGTLQFNSAISAAINYEPIKITINENFNALPGRASPELQEPGVLHQGANFYFKPQLNLPTSYNPSHIEDLISLIQQHHHSCSKDASKVVVEKDKLIEILKPFMNPVSEISNETLSDIVLEKENNLEIVADYKPITITEDIKPVTPELLVIPDAPMLPPLSFNGIPPIVEEEVKKEESVILEEPTVVFPTIPEIAVKPITEQIINYAEPKPINTELVVIPEAPVLPPLSANDIHVVEEEVKIEELVVDDVEPKPAIQELEAIPETPLLPSLSLHDISSMIEEVKKEKLVIFEEPTVVFPTNPEIAEPISEQIINYVEPKPINAELVVIPEAPVLPPLSANDIHVVEEVKIEEPVVVDVEPKPAIQELVAIPEAPLLPSLSLHDISSMIDEEMKKEESVIFEEPTVVFPTIPEIAVKPITEQIINYVEPKPINAELVVIPEAPVLPPLSANDIHVVEEEVKIEELVVVDVEPKPAIQELVAIPEAPLLPSLLLHDISSMIEDEVKKEELVIFEEPTVVFPTNPEIAEPISEHIINYVEPKPINAELVVIPEAPVLPPLSTNDIHVVVEEVKIEETVVVDVEPKPAIQEHVVIPEAPLLPSVSLHDISSMIEEEVKKEESVIFEEPTVVFPLIPEIAVKPITEQIINYVEPKPINAELVVIPEAPVLPPLSANDIHVVGEEVKIEELVVVDVEPKPAIQELVAIPEAQLLPSLSLHDISSMIEEGKKEELVTFEESTGVSTIPEINVRPIEEPIINYVEPKHITLELEVIPEAPVLPQLSYNGIPPVVEEVKIEESIKVEESTGVFPSISEISARPSPEPLVLSEFVESFALENNIFPIATKEVKIEVPVLFEESIEVFPPNAEISSGPTLQEYEITYTYMLEEVSHPNPESVVTVKETLPPTIIPKPSNNLGVFRHVPFVSHLSNRAPKTGNKKQFLYPTSYAHDVVETRIASNMAFKNRMLPNV